ncbi:MAG: hypothetical protein KF911_05700 [Pseudomonadales bacterium]|nr:hypothetical protein [Pseudomonadales bacterium]
MFRWLPLTLLLISAGIAPIAGAWDHHAGALAVADDVVLHVGPVRDLPSDDPLDLNGLPVLPVRVLARVDVNTPVDAGPVHCADARLRPPARAPPAVISH